MKNVYKILLVVGLIAVAIFTVRQMRAAFGVNVGPVGVGVGRDYYDDYDGYYGGYYRDGRGYYRDGRGHYGRPYRRGWFN